MDAKEFYKQCKGNPNIAQDDDGKNLYIPTKNYPHLHVNKDFCVYSTSGSSKKDMIRGEKIYQNNVENIRTEVGINANVVTALNLIP